MIINNLVNFLFGSRDSYTENYFTKKEPKREKIKDPDLINDTPEDREKLALWDAIVNTNGLCPNCKEQLSEGPCGGMAMNLICTNCGNRYWWTNIRSFGAEKL